MLALHGQYWIPSDDIDGMARVRIMSTSILAEKKGIFKIDIGNMFACKWKKSMQ